MSGGGAGKRSGPHGDEGALEPGVRSLAAVAAAVAARHGEGLRTALEEAADRAEPEAIEEILLQSYLFVGYPVALNALALWRELSGRAPPAPAPSEPELWRRRGQSVCRRVYGAQYEALRENVRALHPDLERWMLVEGYGKVLGRSGPDLRVRELAICAQLAVLDVPVQLYSHLRGALHAGATPAQVDEALEAASGYMTDAARITARSTWKRVRSRDPGERER